MDRDILITGFASIASAGPARGLPTTIDAPEVQITRWPTGGVRRAVLVPAFRASDVVAGLRTRRMDRLSVWALVGSALALQDANLPVEILDGERTAIVCGTQFGCAGLTGDFLRSIGANPAKADPATFPETLSNLPASHTAEHFGIRGPNLTLVAGQASAEAALVTAASLLNADEADRVLVLSGDTLTREIYEWYEAASMLAVACTEGGAAGATPRHRTIMPAEGLGACLLETRELARARESRVYGRLHGGWLGPVPDGAAASNRVLQQLCGDAEPEHLLVIEPPGGRAHWIAGLLERQHENPGGGKPLLLIGPSVDFGDFGGAGMLRVGVGLGLLQNSSEGFVLVADRTPHDSQSAAVLLAREARE